MFPSPSARHSQTFPLCARGVRSTRPGCGAGGAGLGALPRRQSRRGPRAGLGFLRYKLGAGRGGGGGEERRASGPGLGAPAPLCFPAGRRRRPGLGVGSPGRRSLRAASLPAAPAAQADNELASSRAEAGLGPAPLGSFSPWLLRSPERGGPFAAGPSRAPSALRAGDTPGRAAGPRRWRSHAPSPAQRMQPETGDWGPGDGMAALRTAGGLRGARAAGRLGPAVPKDGPRVSSPRLPAPGAAGGGRTDRPTLGLRERA